MISQEDRMIVLGHKSTDINNRYTHISEEALYRVSSLTEGLFQVVEGVNRLESSVSQNKAGGLSIQE